MCPLHLVTQKFGRSLATVQNSLRMMSKVSATSFLFSLGFRRRSARVQPRDLANLNADLPLEETAGKRQATMLAVPSSPEITLSFTRTKGKSDGLDHLQHGNNRRQELFKRYDEMWQKYVNEKAEKTRILEKHALHRINHGKNKRFLESIMEVTS